MPHAINDVAMAEGDEGNDIQAFLRDYGGEYGAVEGYNGHERPIDQRDKLDDAKDFEDISDDDLPEEEEATNHIIGDDRANGLHDEDYRGLGGLPAPPQTNGYHVDHDAKEHHAGDLFGESDEAHDLFGEHSSSPEQQRVQPAGHAHPPPQRPGGLALPSKSSLALPGLNRSNQPVRPSQPQQSPLSTSPLSSFQDDGYSPAASASEDETTDEGELSSKARAQRMMFKLAARKRAGENVDDRMADIDMDDFYREFPSFEKYQNPNFVKLFPPKARQFRGKAPFKAPRPIPPTKLTLDLLPDQEKMFKTPGFGNKMDENRAHRDGFISLQQPSGEQDDSDDDPAFNIADENEPIGGMTMQDLAVICGDWDTISSDTASNAFDDNEFTDGEWEAEERARPRKKQRTNLLDSDFSFSIHDSHLSFDEPERATAKLAKSVVLDMNDPNLLIDELVPEQRLKTKREIRRDGILGKALAKRYNISNDEAYDLLKENHQHKVRSTLGAMALEHSLPAARLQYPFYKINLDNKAKRSFHRSQLDVRDGRGREFRFQKQKHIKRKHLRGRDVKDIFAQAEDLYLGDNANVLLLEYSEEAPLMMSNFGMGNRLINYYRKRDADDQERPKRDIGETQVLLTQDKSPFANFGHVDRGEVVPTIQNGMYRAPVFQHKPKSTDFLVGLSSTYTSGHRFYLRNVENLHTVGQQFPLAEVPGEHSRKVTDAAKKRLRALSYRIYSKSIDPSKPKAKALNNENLMPHLPGHDMPQTRSKMREFMKYERAPGKDGAGVWVPQPGSVVPDAETLRGWIKPEEVCLLDSMQVGVQHLSDLGITGDKDADEDKELEEGANIEQQLAPWRTTKNFLAACQGKAMLTLHGEGDPTGRGEGFSFVKTSMKGGFTALGESAADKIEAKKRREHGGHTYNVAKQQQVYDDHIRMVWNKQKDSLSANFEISDTEMEDDADEPRSAYPSGRGATPRASFVGTPSAIARLDDESASQFSRGSAGGDKVLTITRTTRDKYGQLVPTYEKVTNPRVIAAYRKKKMEKSIHAINILDLNPTGDPELDALKRQELEKELARISRNADRRVAREKAKGKHAAGSPATGSPGPSDADGTPQKGGRGRNKDGTARKCANCGQVGHIKTNRKSVTFTCLFCGSQDCESLVAGRNRNSSNGRHSAGSAAAPGNASGFLEQSYSRFIL